MSSFPLCHMVNITAFPARKDNKMKSMFPCAMWFCGAPYPVNRCYIWFASVLISRFFMWVWRCNMLTLWLCWINWFIFMNYTWIYLLVLPLTTRGISIPNPRNAWSHHKPNSSDPWQKSAILSQTWLIYSLLTISNVITNCTCLSLKVKR